MVFKYLNIYFALKIFKQASLYVGVVRAGGAAHSFFALLFCLLHLWHVIGSVLVIISLRCDAKGIDLNSHSFANLRRLKMIHLILIKIILLTLIVKQLE